MPNNRRTPDPVAGSGVQDNDAFVTIEDTAFMQVRRAEVALLRGLFCYPAVRVLEITRALEPEDIFVDAHRRIMGAVADAAHMLVEEGEGDCRVAPEVVAMALRDAGELFHGHVSSALLEASTGHPLAWHDVQALAARSRMGRLRREIEGAGHSLVAAATGPVESLAAALNRLPELNVVARRAGLEVA